VNPFYTDEADRFTLFINHDGGINMKHLRMLPTLLALAITAAGGSVYAQAAAGGAAAPLTRAQVKMETAEFLKTHRWDETNENWVLKSGVEAPAGVKTRAEIKAETNQFLSNNRWDENSSSWVSLKDKPRDLGTMTRAQVRADTRQFVRTHTFDEATQTWVDRPQPKKK
jgi:hypothetical protein